MGIARSVVGCANLDLGIESISPCLRVVCDFSQRCLSEEVMAVRVILM